MMCYVFVLYMISVCDVCSMLACDDVSCVVTWCRMPSRCMLHQRMLPSCAMYHSLPYVLVLNDDVLLCYVGALCVK